MNILITNANSYKAVVVARFIKRNYKHVKIIGLIHKDAGKTFHSKYLDQVILNKQDIQSEEFVENVNKIIEVNRIEVLIPVDSKEIANWLKLKPRLNKTLNYYSDFEVFNELNDKFLFAKLCHKLDIPSPRSYKREEIKHINNAGWYVFKPTKASSSKGVKYFYNLDALKNYCKNYSGEFLVQEYFKGIGGGISFFSKEGEISDYYLHKRLAEYPVSGGSSTMRTKLNSVLEEQILADARKLAKHLNWSGFCMLELKFNSENYTFIEANPRIWGSINQGLVNGANYFKEILGETDKPLKTRIRDKVSYQTPLVFISFLGYLLKGKFKMFRNIFKIFTAEPDINIFTDPKGYIGQFLV